MVKAKYVDDFPKAKKIRNRTNMPIFITLGLLLIFTRRCKNEVPEILQIPKVSTDLVSNITPISAYCTGSVTSCGGSYWVNRGFYWSDINHNPTHAENCKWVDVGSYTGSFTTMLEYLTPGTTYYVRSYAINDAGTGYGKVLTFSTTGSVVGDIIFNPDLTYESIIDIDGNTYKTIKIGSQTWMAENLKTTKYNEGTSIPLIVLLSSWVNLATPGFCWYFNDAVKFESNYGALYNWHAVSTGKLCPTGWHVPSDEEWAILITYLGGSDIAGGKLKETGTIHWIDPNQGGKNSSGFTALPGGTCYGVITDPPSNYKDIGRMAYFWSTTEYSDPVYGFYGANSINISWGGEACYNQTFTKSQGASVRCIKDY